MHLGKKTLVSESLFANNTLKIQLLVFNLNSHYYITDVQLFFFRA